jgi:hypothetical protein
LNGSSYIPVTQTTVANILKETKQTSISNPVSGQVINSNGKISPSPVQQKSTNNVSGTAGTTWVPGNYGMEPKDTGNCDISGSGLILVEKTALSTTTTVNIKTNKDSPFDFGSFTATTGPAGVSYSWDVGLGYTSKSGNRLGLYVSGSGVLGGAITDGESTIDINAGGHIQFIGVRTDSKLNIADIANIESSVNAGVGYGGNLELDATNYKEALKTGKVGAGGSFNIGNILTVGGSSKYEVNFKKLYDKGKNLFNKGR